MVRNTIKKYAGQYLKPLKALKATKAVRSGRKATYPTPYAIAPSMSLPLVPPVSNGHLTAAQILSKGEELIAQGMQLKDAAVLLRKAGLVS